MIFRPKHDDTIIEEVEGIKFLVVHIDQHFAWKTHINCICTNISKKYKAGFYVPSK